MSRIRIALSLAMILGLLAAIALPTYAGNPDHGKQKDKQPPANQPDKPKKEKGGQTVPDGTAEAKTTLCHKPLTPAAKTLQVPESAVPGHLGHGDTLGACLELTPSPSPTATLPITYTTTITLCHKPGTPAEKTLVLPVSAGPGHMRHGDLMGPCVEITPTVTPTATVPPTPALEAGPTITNTGPVTICHKPGTLAEHTLVIRAPAVPAHLRHGDELGACLAPPETEDASPAQAYYPQWVVASKR